jgi:RNA polymerase sigma-70 factor (ECF subfamily)
MMTRALVCADTTREYSLNSLSDEELVVRAKIGDGLSYVELCQRHSGMATRIIYRIVRNNEDTEDILQEAVLKGYRHLAGFDGRAKFSTWFTRISVNCALMLLRKRKSRYAQSLQEFTRGEGGECLQFPDGSPSPECIALKAELSMRLKQAIQRLPPVLRGVTEIRQSGDFSVSEIAGMAGLTVAATKSRLLRARKELTSRMVPLTQRTRSLSHGRGHQADSIDTKAPILAFV